MGTSTIARFIVSVLWIAPALAGADYHVGPDQRYAEPGDVPWSSLAAGDRVYIHYRPEPYHSLVTITRSGTAGNPIQVIGLSGPDGARPVMSAQDAIVSPNVGPTSHRSLVSAGVFVIDGDKYAARPAHIEIANLTLRDMGLGSFFLDPLAVGPLTAEISDIATTIPVALVGAFVTFPVTVRIGQEQIRVTAKTGTSLTVTRGYNGTTAQSHSAGDAVYNEYGRGNAGLYVYLGDHITLKDCLITYNGNGLFVNSPGSEAALTSTNILISGNTFVNNGVAGSDRQHHSYTEGSGVTFEYNSYLSLRTGSSGISLKDRSAGTVIRYNYIECGGYCLDLVECENNKTICAQPAYRETFIYGNVLINKPSDNGQRSARTFIHYGFDGTPANDRAGTLYLYHNTFVQAASDQYYGYYAKQSSNQDVIDARNNVFYQIPASPTIFRMILGNPGVVNLGVNWRSPKIGISYSTPFFATGESDLFTDMTNNPGFVDASGRDYRIVQGSTAAGKTGPLAIAVTSNSLGLDLKPTQQFVPGLLPMVRKSLTDAGAYQYLDTWVFRRR